MAEGHDVHDSQWRSLPSSSSPLPSVCYSSFQTWLPVGSPLQQLWTSDHQEHDSQDCYTGMQLNELPLSNLYEELVCSSQSASSLVPLNSGASGPRCDVVKQGYLGKREQNQKRYFVLRSGGHDGLSRLEWYKNQDKFTAMDKSSGKAAPFSSSKQGVIYLRCCLGVSRVGSSKQGHTVALYAKDRTLVLVMADLQEQDEWYLAIRKLVEEEREDEDHGEEFEDEDDGYCTLPAAAFYKEVWPVTVKPRGLGRSKSLAGETRLCLTATSLILVRVSASNDLPSVTIPLLSVRRFGHLDGSFFLELGRSAPNGPGEIWMEARDQGNSTVAQNIHEVIRETVRTLRALPDFSRSPTSNNNRPQALLVSKRSRTKCRDRLLSARPLGSPLALAQSNPEIQSSLKHNPLEHCNLDKVDVESSLSCTSRLSPFRSQQGSTSETDSYVEMKSDHGSVSGWELGDDGEKHGYMMMSPSSVLPQDDYVIMASPHKHTRSAYSSPSFSLPTSFNSSTSDGYSPPHPSHHHTHEHHLPHWLVTSVRQRGAENGQTPMSSADTAREEKSAQPRPQPAQTRTMTSPMGSVAGSHLMAPFDMRRPVYTRPVEASPKSGTDQSSPLRSAQFKSGRRHRLSSCLPSCLQAEDRS